MLTKIIWNDELRIGLITVYLRTLDKTAIVDSDGVSFCDIDPSKISYAKGLREKGYATSVLVYNIEE